MDEQKVRRPRRTAEQKAADIDAKIQKLNEDLESIEARRTAANQEFDAKAAAVFFSGIGLCGTCVPLDLRLLPSGVFDAG